MKNAGTFLLEVGIIVLVIALKLVQLDALLKLALSIDGGHGDRSVSNKEPVADKMWNPFLHLEMAFSLIVHIVFPNVVLVFLGDHSCMPSSNFGKCVCLLVVKD